MSDRPVTDPRVATATVDVPHPGDPPGGAHDGPAQPESSAPDRVAPGPDASLRALCPYLLAADGDWRSATAAREHRCTAVAPPAPLTVDKQRRTCLTADHRACATYLAARHVLVTDDPTAPEARRSVDGNGSIDTDAPVSLRWPVPRTAPLVLERGRPSLRSIAVDRSVAQVALVALMIVAFGVLAVARLSASPGGVIAPTPSAAASPAASASLPTSPSAATSSTPAATAEASPSPAPSASPSPAASPSASRTYRVRSGDTLTSIAARYGTTVAALQAANKLKSPSLIRVGQLLVIP